MRFGWILVTLAVVSCSPVKDLNRVNNNYIEKSIFNGEWRHRGVIVDKNYNQSGTFVGLQGDLDHVVFEVTEKLLIARRAHAHVPGSESANPGQQTWVAAFPIIKHFDIRRRYNDQNGIEDNVIIENDSDRPWNERQYVRIDWSTNLVADAQFNDFVKTESIQNVTRNSLGEDKEPFRVKASDDYLETTIDMLAKPNESVCDSIGDWNCDASRVRVKYSFSKIVDEEREQYEKMNYPDYLPLIYGTDKKNELCLKGDEGCGNLQELWLNQTPTGTEICDPKRHSVDECDQYKIPVFTRFGFFRTERNKYDRENGFTLSGREQLINRWNIWKSTKKEDGSVIPVAERETKTIVYYLNPSFPSDLWDVTQRMADEWNSAFVAAVASAKGINSAAVRNIYGRMFEIRINDCNHSNLANYVKEKDLEANLHSQGLYPIEDGNLEQACAYVEWLSEKKNISPKFTWQEFGDLRYSFLNYTNKAELSGPLGYGPSSTDPLTGEIVAANANIYGASIDVYASLGADIVEFMNGGMSAEDIMNGTKVRGQVGHSRPQVARSVSNSELAAYSALLDRRIEEISKDDYLREIPSSSLLDELKILKDSAFEDQYLVSDEMARLFSIHGQGAWSGNNSQNSFDRARPSNWAKSIIPVQEGSFQERSSSFLDEYNKKEEFFGKKSACFFSEMVEPAVVELAKSLVGKTWDEAYRLIREEIYRATATHELGHTFGLRHNFEASADPMNYFPNFWDVDTHDERMSLNNRKSEMKYSSIMDYTQRFNSDFAGIGLYDRAAIKFGYGGTIEVFDESKEEFVPKGWFSNIDLFNYKDLPLLYSGDSVDAKLDKHYDDVRARFRRGDETARIEVQSLGIKPNAENMFKRKDVRFKDFYRSFLTRLFGVDSPLGNIYEVPYKFCSDAYASGGNITCNRWDMGANAEEIVDNAAEMYESYYFFNAFRGDKIQMSPSSYMARLYSRTYQPMLNAFRYVYFYRRSSLRIWPLMQDWTAASYKGVNFFGRVLQTVEPGRYCLSDNMYLPENEVSVCRDPVNIDMPAGRFFNTNWTDEFFFKPQNIGNFYDKILAIRALTDSAAFMTRDMSTMFNRGAFSIGYYRVFAPELIRLFGSIVQNDTYDIAPQLSIVDGNPQINYRNIVNGMSEMTADKSVRIKPSQSWMMRYYALVLPMVRYTSTLDGRLDFAKRARITLVGSKNDPDIDPSLEQIVFTDPHTALKYRAAVIESEDMSLGFQILKDASKFISDGTDSNPVGPWKLASNAVKQAELELAAAKKSGGDGLIREKQNNLRLATNAMHQLDARLREKIQLIEMVKRLGDLLEFGN